MSIILGQAHQLGIVVRDIETTMNYWTGTMGIGPFFYIEDVPVIEFNYKGNPSPVKCKAGLCYSGPMQIELIEPVGNAPSVYKDFLDAGKEGLHHLGYLSENYDADMQKALNAGLQVEQSGVVFNEHGRFTYFASTGHDGTVMELISMSDTLREMFQMVKAAAESWDGTDPIRQIG